MKSGLDIRGFSVWWATGKSGKEVLGVWYGRTTVVGTTGEVLVLEKRDKAIKVLPTYPSKECPLWIPVAVVFSESSFPYDGREWGINKDDACEKVVDGYRGDFEAAAREGGYPDENDYDYDSDETTDPIEGAPDGYDSALGDTDYGSDQN